MLYANYLRDKKQSLVKFAEVEGTSPLDLPKSKGKAPKNYQIYGNSTQETTGKNLFDKSISIQDPIKNETELPNTIYGYSILAKNKICDILKPNTTYTISCEIECTAIPDDCTYSTGILGFLIYKAVSGYTSISLYIDHQLSVGEKYQYTKTFTTPLKFDSGGNYELLCYMNKYLNSDNKIVTASVIYRNIQIEEGSTATDYEAYHTSPSPDFPSAVESVGDLTTKNLLGLTGRTASVSLSSANDETKFLKGYAYWNNISTAGSITYTFNDNNSYTLIAKNVASSISFPIKAHPNTTYTASAANISLSVGSYTLMVGFYEQDGTYINGAQGSSNKLTYTFSTPENTAYIVLGVRIITAVYDDVGNILTVEKFQLELGSTATSYEPYHKYDIPISIYGKNLIKYPYQYTTRDINGIRFTDNGDGSVTMNGKATANAIWFMYLNRTNLIGGLSSGDKITLSVKSNKSFSGALRVVCNYFDTGGTEKDANMSITAANSSITNRITALWKGMEIYIVVLKGQTVDNITIYPQLEKGSPATPYEPYKGKTTTHIYLDEPLRKVGDYADYIDFKNQKVVRNIVEDSLYANNFYKKLSSVARFGRVKTSIKQKLDTHMLSTILNYDFSWTKDVESIFHHTGAYYNYYWSVYWSRLGLTYDGTNVYRTDDTEQTPLTNSEVLNIANEWLNTLSDKDKKVFMILDTPTEESISIPNLALPKSEKATMIVNTTVKPSNIYAKYIKT